ncbi:Trk family potassium uptake protein [Oscillospiraceae bacterium HV4-5-C5C]|nr:Trk family potassium uptake protein [Oscillospiraceae bacterium HV4-5-C5C]
MKTGRKPPAIRGGRPVRPTDCGRHLNHQIIDQQTTGRSELGGGPPRRLTPPQIIVLSFALIILGGSFLLLLPPARQPGVSVSLIDALFTATSAVCVTGLVTVNTAATWSVFGKVVLLLLIQTGGLSLVTLFSFFMVNLGKRLSLQDRLTIQAAYNQTTLGGLTHLVRLAVKVTLLCEAGGALLLTLSFRQQGYTWLRAGGYGLFHSVSAFCNAGFDILGPDSLLPYAGNRSLLLILMLLIIAGGLGFVVWGELLRRWATLWSPRRQARARLSLHSRLVLLMTGLLLAGGTLLIYAAERHNPATLGELPAGQRWWSSLFQSVTLRTAGFAAMPQSALTESGKLLSSLLMLIGGSPGGTAGGIKTVTIAILLCDSWSTLMGRRRTEAFHRSIANPTVKKALAITMLMSLLLALATGLLSLTEAQMPYPHAWLDLLYETASALGTVGLSTGLTPYLSPAGKIILMLCMFIGRIGPITLLVSLSRRYRENDDLLEYPEEDVVIG